jgi:hypothetical protein
LPFFFRILSLFCGREDLPRTLIFKQKKLISCQWYFFGKKRGDSRLLAVCCSVIDNELCKLVVDVSVVEVVDERIIFEFKGVREDRRGVGRVGPKC